MSRRESGQARALLGRESPALFRLPTALRRLTLSTAVCLIGAGVFGWFVKVDKLVPATGILDTRARLLEIRAPMEARVSRIHVAADARIRRGDTLVTLDARLTTADRNREQERMRAAARRLGIALARLTPLVSRPRLAEISDTLPTRAGPVNDTVSYGLFSHAVRQEIRTRETTLEQARSRWRVQQNALPVARTRMTLLREKERQMAGLLEAGTISRDQYNDVRLQQLAGRQSINDIQSRLKQAAGSVRQIESDNRLWRARWRSDQLQAVYDAEADWRDARSAARRFALLEADHVLQAPADGRVSEVALAGAGVVTSPGEVLLSVRPDYTTDDLYTDLRLPSRLATWVQPGMTFRATPTGNNPEDHGSLHGTVEWLSAHTPDSEEDERQYRLHGRIDRVELPPGASESARLLRPGLQLTVQIRTGERRLLRYLFEPFSNGLRQALREP